MILHIIIKLKEQTVYFDGRSYPHYEIGWKKGEDIYSWNGLQRRSDEIESWKEIC